METYHSLRTAAFPRLHGCWFPWIACPIWFMARFKRPLPASKSVAVVEAGTKRPADAEEASNRGAHAAVDWKSMVGKN